MNPQQSQQQPYVSFQDSLVGRALQNLGGQISNYFQPQSVISPVPSNQTSAPSFAPSPFQMTLDQLKNLFVGQNQPSQAQNLQAVKGAVNTLSPTPTPTPGWDRGFVMNTPDQYIPTITDAGKTYNVPTNILSGALANESMQWNPNVISGKLNSPQGAQGIAQFMPTTAQGMGINPMNPDQAIHGMARLLASYYKRFGNSWENALAAYNAGPGNVEKYGGIPPFTETKNYVKNILLNANHTFNQK